MPPQGPHPEFPYTLDLRTGAFERGGVAPFPSDFVTAADPADHAVYVTQRGLLGFRVIENFDAPLIKPNVQRFKGLGEMNAEELWETTMDPERRTLLQVGLEDAAIADEIFTVLMGENVEYRRNFIQRNAKDVRFLDI